MEAHLLVIAEEVVVSEVEEVLTVVAVEDLEANLIEEGAAQVEEDLVEVGQEEAVLEEEVTEVEVQEVNEN